MALQLLLSKKLKGSACLAVGLLACLVWLAFGSVARSETYDKFSGFRNEVLDLVAGAKEHLTVVTDYLTDGEIVTALYLAKYRGLQVKVFLGALQANSPMSRLRYLKRQKIDAYLIPHNFPVKRGTVIFADGRGFESPNSLNNTAKKNTYALHAISGQRLQQMTKAYQGALVQPREAIATQLPTVSRERKLGNIATNPPSPHRRYQKGNNQALPKIYAPDNNQDGTSLSQPEAPYNYDEHSHRQRRAPSGMPTSLPDKTLFQLKGPEDRDDQGTSQPRF